MQERVGPKGFAKKVKNNLPFWMEQAPEIPGLLYSSLHKLSHQGLTIQSEQIERLEARIDEQNRQQKNRAIGFVLILFGLLLPIESEYQSWIQLGLLVAGGLYLVKK